MDLYIIKKSFKKFFNDDGMTYSGATAFFAILSIIPFVALIIFLAGFFLDSNFISVFVNYIEEIVGGGVAQTLESIIQNSRDASGISSIVSFVVLVVIATGFFSQIRKGLNVMWEREDRGSKSAKGKVEKIAKRRFTSFLIIIGIVVLLVLFFAVSIFLSYLKEITPELDLTIREILFQVLNYILIFFLMALIFSLIFGFLPNRKINYGNALKGALFTAALFLIGQIIIGLYFQILSPGSSYGAIGSLIVLLLWFYYSAIVFYIGAEFTWLRVKG